MSFAAVIISPMPCTIFNTPPSLILPRTTNASPIIPANCEIIPATFLKVGPFFSKSLKYLINSSKSDKNIATPVIAKDNLKLPSSFKNLMAVVIPLAIFQAANPAPIATTTAKTSLRCLFIPSVISSICFLTSSKKLYSGSFIPRPPSAPAPLPAPALPPPASLSSGDIIFNSSIPSVAFFSFFAALVALPNPSDTLSVLSTKPPIDSEALSNDAEKSVSLIPKKPAMVSAKYLITFAAAIA